MSPGPAEEAGAPGSFRRRAYVVIFEHDTFGGKAFDVALLVAVGLSVLTVMLDSVDAIRQSHGATLRAAEWFFTGLFTVEYVLRLYAAPRRLTWALSFFGWVDLFAVLPSYASVFLPGAESLIVLRVLRLLRVFQVLKLVRYYRESATLMSALRASIPKITVFLGAVLCVVMIIGSAMYFVEGAEHGFTSIPVSVYWAIVTLTTVGFGDITPKTPLGQMIASTLMVLGYGIIAVPTGIVSAEMVKASPRGGPDDVRRCAGCDAAGHAESARFCHQCARPLPRGGAEPVRGPAAGDSGSGGAG